MIDKVFPRKLNSSKDARVRGKDEMIDAVNVTIDDNYDDFSNANIESPSGNFGVLKPVKGNTAVENDSSLNFTANGRVVGSCVDERNNSIYYFLASGDASEQGVYVYKESDNQISPVITSSLFNFSTTSFIESNIVYIPDATGDAGVKAILFFTDDINEPRKIDLSRISDGQAHSFDDPVAFLDFISTCPRTPIDPPVASFDNDPLVTVSNFKGKKGFQFAYQNIYKSGDISALSTYSKLYVPSAYIQQGTSPNASFYNENVLAVQIPSGSLTSEVERIRLLTREGNDGDWFVVDEIDYVGGTPQYNFYNDSVLTILPEAESRRQFDAVPKKARAQEVTNNRLFFGNYVEGFNVSPIQANITYETSERPQDFITFNLTMKAEVRQTNNPAGFSNCVNRVAAYRLSTSELPDDGVKANTQIIFNVTLAPDNNFHFYESRGGYHGSTRYNFIRPLDGGLVEEPYAQNIDDQVSSAFSKKGNQYFGTEQSHSLFDNNKSRKSGVGFDPYGDTLFDETEGQPLWRGVYTGSGDFYSNTVTQDLEFRGTPATYGTNAGNPFIIEGKTLKFSGSFITLADLTKQQLSDAIRGLLIPPPPRTDTSDFLSGGIDPIDALNINVLSRISTSSYNIDLGLNNLDKINVYNGIDYRSKLVVAVGNQQSLLTPESAQYQNPAGYFIVNKAQPEFRLRDITTKYNLNTTPDVSADLKDEVRSEDVFFALDLITLGDFETLTCIPDVLIDMAPILPEDSETFLSADDLLSTNLFDGWVCATPDWLQFQSPDLDEAEWNDIFTLCGTELYQVTQGIFSLQDATDGLFTKRLIPLYFTEFVSEDLISAVDPEAYNDYLAVTSVFENNIKSWLGYIIPSGAVVTFTNDIEGYIASSFGTVSGTVRPDKFLTFTGGRLINTFEDYVNSAAVNGKYFENRDEAYFDYAFSLVDGEAGAAGRVTGAGPSGMSRSSVSYQTIMCGVSPWCGFGEDGFQELRVKLNNMPLINNVDGDTDIDLTNFADNPGGFNLADSVFTEGLEDVDTLALRKHAHVELFDFDTTYIPPFDGTGEQPYKSFKTKSNHDFGIVYYDQRGRASDVMPIGSVYVGGYNTFSSDKRGPVKIQVNLEGQTPPSWAWNYQIVYGGNSTVDKFVQYSTGGAFVEFNSLDPENNGNIYVSLNYLQNNNSVSYSEAFGAISSDGSKEFYTYKEGDKLRIISYFEALSPGENPLDAREFPDAYEFDVVGTVTLGDDSDNPLINPDEETPAACIGQFVILRNNPSAIGFNYQSVQSSIQNNSPQPTTNQHFWNNGCIVELYSPRKNQDAENRVYYEVGKNYRVIRNSSVTANPVDWEQANIVVTEGDVYFRRLPVNIPRYSEALNAYQNLIETGGSVTPRFLDYFLETETFTDTIVGAKQHNWGKPKIVNRFQREIRRDSSITFGDVNNYSLPILRYGTFDVTTSNFKDLPNTHGTIQKLVDRGDSIFVVQENKISELPVSRTTLSDQAGNDIVVASTKALGNQRFYAGDFGCSTNPESVTKIGESIYFANKEKFEVYKFNPSNGVAIISEYGLKSYFYDLFKTAIDTANSGSVGPVRVVGGYDPLLDEFVISVHNDVIISVSGVSEVLQDLATPIPPVYISGPPTAVDLQADLDAALADIANLDSQAINYQQTIVELQQTINSLYTQIGNVIDQTSEDVAELGSILDEQNQIAIDDLNEEINSLNDEAGVIESEFIASLQEQSQFHNNIRSQAETIEANLQAQIADYSLGTGSPRAALWDEGDTLVIPDVLDIEIVKRANASFELGDEVSLTGYLLIMLEYQNEVKRYLGVPEGGLWDNTQGFIRLRGGGAFTDYFIGYGLPTTDTISQTIDGVDIDSDVNSIPEDSILFQEPDFLSKWVGDTGLVSDPGYDFGIRRECIILIDVLNGETFNLANEDIADLEVDVTTLTAEVQTGIEIKRDLLSQIADFVNGIHNAEVTRYDEEDYLDPNTGQPPLRVFGDQFGQSADGEVVSVAPTPLKAMYDAIQDDPVNYQYLEELILDDNNGLRYTQILDLIESGLGTYNSSLNDEFNNFQSVNAALEVTRNTLADNLFNVSQYVYNVERDLGGSAPVYVAGGGIPLEYFNLLAGGTTPTSADIVTALDNSSIDDAQLQTGFPNIVTAVQGITTGVIDFTIGPDDGTLEAEILSEGFKNSIVGVLDVLRKVDEAVSYGADTGIITDTTLSEIAASENTGIITEQLEGIAQLYSAVDAGGNPLGDIPSLDKLILDLKNLAGKAITNVANRFFYDPTALNFGGLGVDPDTLGSRSDEGPINTFQTITSGAYSASQYSDRFSDLNSLLENISVAIDDLYRFQILLGSPLAGGQEFVPDYNNFAESDSEGNSFYATPQIYNAPLDALGQSQYPAVGFTNDTGYFTKGLTAVDVMYGKPIYSPAFVDGFTAYAGVKNFLFHLGETIGRYAPLQNSDGVVAFQTDPLNNNVIQGASFYDTPFGSGGGSGRVPFLFNNADIRDLLFPSVITAISDSVIANLTDEDGTIVINEVEIPPLQSEAVIQGIINAVASEVLSRSVQEIPKFTADFLANPNNQNASARADIDADGTVATADLLSFLAVYGQESDDLFPPDADVIEGVQSLISNAEFINSIATSVSALLGYYNGAGYTPDVTAPSTSQIGQFIQTETAFNT